MPSSTSRFLAHPAGDDSVCCKGELLQRGLGLLATARHYHLQRAPITSRVPPWWSCLRPTRLLTRLNMPPTSPIIARCFGFKCAPVATHAAHDATFCVATSIRMTISRTTSERKCQLDNAHECPVSASKANEMSQCVLT